MSIIDRSWRDVLVGSFNTSFFVGLAILSLYGDGFAKSLPSFEKDWSIYMAVPAINGILTVLIVFVMNHFLAKWKYMKRDDRESEKRLMITAFAAGASGFFMAVSAIGTFLISVLIIYLTFTRIRQFIKKMGELLQVGYIADKTDVALFFNFFLNLIITFSVINLSLNEAHQSLALTQGFNFGDNVGGVVDSLYFTIISMTTVGYGDIVPQTSLAKIFVVLECLTSYIMMGLMIGILSRGVNFKK